MGKSKFAKPCKRTASILDTELDTLRGTFLSNAQAPEGLGRLDHEEEVKKYVFLDNDDLIEHRMVCDEADFYAYADLEPETLPDDEFDDTEPVRSFAQVDNESVSWTKFLVFLRQIDTVEKLYAFSETFDIADFGFWATEHSEEIADAEDRFYNVLDSRKNDIVAEAALRSAEVMHEEREIAEIELKNEVTKVIGGMAIAVANAVSDIELTDLAHSWPVEAVERIFGYNEMHRRWLMFSALIAQRRNELPHFPGVCFMVKREKRVKVLTEALFQRAIAEGFVVA